MKSHIHPLLVLLSTSLLFVLLAGNAGAVDIDYRTIDALTVNAGMSFDTGSGQVAFSGRPDVYTLDDGSIWDSGAGSYSSGGRATLTDETVSGNRIQFTLAPVLSQAEFLDYTDYNGGDHSSQGELAFEGPIMVDATIGSRVADIRGTILVVSDVETWYGQPRYNFFIAEVGEVVFFDGQLELGGDGTWQPGMFDDNFSSDGPLRIDFADVVTDAQPRLLLARDAVWTFTDEVTNGLGPDPVRDYPTDAAGRAWNDPDFDPASSADRSGETPAAIPWRNGPGPLGAGVMEDVPLATELDGIDDATDAQQNDVTTYLFRTELELPDLSNAERLEILLLSDDGGSLYFNGVEVFRTANLAGVELGTTTTTGEGGGGQERFVRYTIPTASLAELNPGANSIAFELHQVNTTSSDAGFGLELTAYMPVPEPATSLLVTVALACLWIGTGRRRPC